MKGLIFSLILLITGCSSQPRVVLPEGDTATSVHKQIYVTSHGWHTGIVVPAREMNEALPALTERFKGVMWYEIGWGDKGFYQAQEVTSGLTMQAMFWSSGAVMHVVSIPMSVERYFPNSELIAVNLTDVQLNSLLAFIAQSFERDEEQRVIVLKKGIYGNSQFYGAKGRYSILNTCNKWTAKGLKSAGMDINPTFKLTASSVMDFLQAEQSQHVPSDEALTCFPAR
ncbi:TIGR02117 family protein [Leminorella richardii]|uniref:TIGR02117 family protein n=1 Tax=Leminorella richardii TaxID=158841 RepID=UPI000DBE4D7C|nr:TIGR02117 family protein [Leminorella richardii]